MNAAIMNRRSESGWLAAICCRLIVNGQLSVASCPKAHNRPRTTGIQSNHKQQIAESIPVVA
jgi:hypothetical protein